MNGSELISFFGFLLLIGVLLALDIGVFHKRDHIIKIREAAIWTVIWISVALLFDIFIFARAEWIHGISDAEGLTEYYDTYYPGSALMKYDSSLDYAANLKFFRHTLGMEYLTGYLMEKALSVDNIFVMIMIFISFGVERRYYHRVLFWGILGAIILRFIFIFTAAALISRFAWVLGIFGAVLLFSGFKLFFGKEAEERIDTENHPVVKFASRLFNVYPKPAGHSFFVREDGKLYVTALFVVLLVIEFSDVIFAVDSIPAVFSVTKDPFVVFFSNIFAILGLRSLFFLLDGIVAKFSMLKYGLGVLLVFIGGKMLVELLFHIEIGIATSLVAIVSILVVSILASLFVRRR